MRTSASDARGRVGAEGLYAGGSFLREAGAVGFELAVVGAA